MTTGTVNLKQTLIAAASGAISGASALIPGGKLATTFISGGINAVLGAGSYALNQIANGKTIDKADLAKSTAVGFVSGVAGNLFRVNSTSSLRNSGTALLDKASRKLTNGIANSSTSTIKRAFQYFDDGISVINKYARRAGTNSGVGSSIGCFLSRLFVG